MTFEKRILAETTITGEEIQKEVFVETITETKEVIRTKDRLESEIAQKTNLIENTQSEVLVLQGKLDEINNLDSKK